MRLPVLAAWVPLPENVAEIVWVPLADGVYVTEQLPALRVQVSLPKLPFPPLHATLPEALSDLVVMSVTVAVHVVDAPAAIFFGLQAIVVWVLSGALVDATGDAADWPSTFTAVTTQ